MNSAPSQSLLNLLLESGVSSNEEAIQLATNLNGGSWVGQVLDSGKVDENRFLSAIGNFFRVPVVSIDAKKIDRETLSMLPSRFVFQHHILPIEVKENSVVLATYDLFNSIGRQLALEGNVAHGHRGAPVASGWANEFARQKSGDRRTRLDNSNSQRRVNQSASAQPWRAAVQF